MAAVLATALWGSIGKPTEPMTVPDGSYRWRISTEPLRRVVDKVGGRTRPTASAASGSGPAWSALLQRQSENRRR